MKTTDFNEVETNQLVLMLKQIDEWMHGQVVALCKTRLMPRQSGVDAEIWSYPGNRHVVITRANGTLEWALVYGTLRETICAANKMLDAIAEVHDLNEELEHQLLAA